MKFFNTNQIESFNSITVSSGDAKKSYLYDRNFSTKWQSAGSNDVTTETIEIVWATEKTIDRISLITHNLKSYTIQYWNGSAYADFSTPISESANTATSNFHSFNSVSTLKIKLSATTTITADAQKEISELLAYAEYFAIPAGYYPDSENPGFYYKQTEHEKVDGGSLVVIEGTRGKYRNVFNFERIPKTYYDYIKALKDVHQSFWIMPDTNFINEQYYCNLTSDILFRRVFAYVTSTDEQCYSGSFEVKET